MIVAEIFKRRDGKVTGFSVEGHANTAPHGQDIYCAGVSALTQSAFLCIRDHLKYKHEMEEDHGKLNVHLKRSPNALTEAVFQTMIIGLQEMEKIAPQVVKVNFTVK